MYLVRLLHSVQEAWWPISLRLGLRLPLFFSLLIFLQAAGLRPVIAENHALPSPDGAGRVGCPECRNDGSEIARRLQKADELYAQFKTKEALQELLKVLHVEPTNAEALSKAARAYIDYGDMIPEVGGDWQEKKIKHYLTAEEYARKAVKFEPDSTWGYFYVAASLGKIAMLSPTAKQIDLSKEIRAAVERAIALDPQNGFAYHVYGVWQRRMAEVGQMKRLLSAAVLWRSVPQGSMEKSADYLKKAVSLNPTVIVHRLELAKTYIAMGRWQLARDSLNSVQELPIQFSDDAQHKKEAQRLLQELRGR